MTAGLDLDALTAIDMHVHAEVSSNGSRSLPGELEAASSAYFKIADPRRPTLGEIAAYYRERQLACVVFTVDAEAASGQPPVPNEEEALAVATHKPGVHIDLSGWSPKYFPPQLVHYANTLLQDKVMFGSDYPLLTPDRWLADFAKLPIKPSVREKILKTNAARLLGLTPG